MLRFVRGLYLPNQLELSGYGRHAALSRDVLLL